MTPLDAAKLLDLPADASPEQLEARFLELRRKLEDKIAKAPTPGLQAKYRESLADITTAFETLTLAADSSALPVLQKQSPGPGAMSPAASPAAPLPDHQKSKAKNKKSGKEFLVVALLAVVLLAAGGWFVMKTRTENAEKIRVAAETAQAKQTAEQAEAARMAALKTSLRTKLAEARVGWEALESELQDAERRTNDLKSELRSLRDATAVKKAELSAQVASQEIYTKWLKNHLLRHPAKLARARADELLQSGASVEAAAVVEEIFSGLKALDEDIASRRKYFFNTTTSIRLHSKPEGVRWVLTDAFGRTQEGTTPAQVKDLPLTHLVTDGVAVAPFAGIEQRGEFTTGKIAVRFSRIGWPAVIKSDTALMEDNPILEAEFPEGAVAVSSLPPGVPFTITQAAGDLGWTASGTTPATITQVPLGRVVVRVARPGYVDVRQELAVEAGKTSKTTDLDHRSQPVHIQVEEAARILVDGKLVGTQKAELTTLTPGEHTLHLEAKGYSAYRTKFTVAQKATPVVRLAYNFKQLAAENITCSPCSGAGSLQHQGRCNQCNGTGRRDCPDCKNGVSGYVQGDFGGGVMGPKMVMCSACNRKGYFVCESCTNGTAKWRSTCATCSGDGKVSKLQLSP